MRIGFNSKGYITCTGYCGVFYGLVISVQNYGCFIREIEAGSPERCLSMLESSDGAVIQTKETCLDAAKQLRSPKKLIKK